MKRNHFLFSMIYILSVAVQVFADEVTIVDKNGVKVNLTSVETKEINLLIDKVIFITIPVSNISTICFAEDGATLLLKTAYGQELKGTSDSKLEGTYEFGKYSIALSDIKSVDFIRAPRLSEDIIREEIKEEQEKDKKEIYKKNTTKDTEEIKQEKNALSIDPDYKKAHLKLQHPFPLYTDDKGLFTISCEESLLSVIFNAIINSNFWNTYFTYRQSCHESKPFICFHATLLVRHERRSSSGPTVGGYFTIYYYVYNDYLSLQLIDLQNGQTLLDTEEYVRGGYREPSVPEVPQAYMLVGLFDRAALVAMGERKDGRAVFIPMCSHALTRKESIQYYESGYYTTHKTHIAAIEALGKFGPESIPALARAFKNNTEKVGVYNPDGDARRLAVVNALDFISKSLENGTLHEDKIKKLKKIIQDIKNNKGEH